ncbi:MAG: PQQ-binding-like beta-propeller repeat protein [Clostridia bacterium]|nr:PQQ-binding-like beta-propeller repeat protein [Clostridia bacterium]
MKFLKKSITFFVAILMIFACTFQCFAVNVTSANTPVSADEAELLWCKQFGTSYKNAPSTMAVVDDSLLVMSGKTLYKLNVKNGKILKQAEMAEAPSYNYTAPFYADGVVYCPLDNGTIQAFNFKSLKSMWIYKDKLGGQSLSPINYSDGCIFTGFWNNEDAYANFVCIDVKDENKKDQKEAKNAKWAYKSLGGFYWAGCDFSGENVIVGTDDGTLYANKPSKILSLNKNTGKLTDSLSITGDQRSSITINGNTVYFVTKAGYLYSVKVNNGKFDSASLKKLNLGGASTSTPVICNGRLYVGVQGKSMKEGSIKVTDPSKMTVIYSAPANGYPQNNVLVCDKNLKDSGKVYVYTTYNALPGGISVYTDSVGQTKAQKAELFNPEGDKANYSVSTIVCDNDGTLFYKNDSGYIFAIANKNRKSESGIKKFFSAIINFFRNLFK